MTPEQASQKYHWVKYNSATNTIELYMDNFMLSTSRICEAKFYMEHMLHITPRYDKTRMKPWFYTWGEYVHYCLEIFYESFKTTKQPPLVDKWLERCKLKWQQMKMEDYNLDTAFKTDRARYEDIGGWEGVAGFLIDYYAYYMDLRVRVIDTEITFGHNKEVLLGEFRLPEILSEYHPVPSPIGEQYNITQKQKLYQVKCYLTGRIDLLVDNGYKIGPVDHKNTHKFDGYEHEDFNPHDGITGYILAINEILSRYRNAGLTTIPASSGGWIYHLSACRPSQPRDKTKQKGPRFKASVIDKTPTQLDDYKARQLSTYKRIAELLFNDKVPEWNTVTCNNIFFRPCEYRTIHQQPSNEWAHIIRDHYETGKQWDTREHSAKEAVASDNTGNEQPKSA